MSGAEITKAFNDRIEAFGLFVSRLVVHDQDSAQQATDFVKGIKEYKKAVNDYWGPICEANHKSWKMSTGRRKEFLDPADQAEKAIKKKIGDYMLEEKRKAQEEEDRRRREAEAQAEKERIAEVERLRAEGALDEAEHIAEQPLDVAPVAKAEVPKIDGLSGREKWEVEITDPEAFMVFCAASKHFRYLLTINMKEANKLAAAQKELFQFPGARAVKSLVTAVRS